MNVVIGIAGRIGAGKDVVASFLDEKHGFQVLRFSAPLKEEVKDRLSRTVLAIAHLGGHYCLAKESVDEFLDRLLNVMKPKGVRELLQEYGTEVRRADDPDYWTKAWMRAYDRLSPPRTVVVPDVRFPNEASTIRKLGGLVIRIERPSLGPPGNHPSETALLDWPYDKVFISDGTIEALERQVEEWVLPVLSR